MVELPLFHDDGGPKEESAMGQLFDHEGLEGKPSAQSHTALRIGMFDLAKIIEFQGAFSCRIFAHAYFGPHRDCGTGPRTLGLGPVWVRSDWFGVVRISSVLFGRHAGENAEGRGEEFGVGNLLHIDKGRKTRFCKPRKCRVWGFGFRVSGFGFRVSGFGCRESGGLCEFRLKPAGEYRIWTAS
jgi:hypothetical protein